MIRKPPSGSPTTESKAPAPAGPRVLESDDILQGEGEVAIRHNGRLYRLSRTRSGKLILT
ncbi:MAG TPA: hemin uptake protein HemP [Usitatibacter sp.]|nr:hemin uptake protein HemP [Usitatibacter sp.]